MSIFLHTLEVRLVEITVMGYNNELRFVSIRFDKLVQAVKTVYGNNMKESIILKAISPSYCKSCVVPSQTKQAFWTVKLARICTPR